jgi:hypothetical protein
LVYHYHWADSGITYTLGFLMASPFPRVASTASVIFLSGSSTPQQSFMVSPFALAYWDLGTKANEFRGYGGFDAAGVFDL